MKIIYKGETTKEMDVQNFYKDISMILSAEDISSGSKEIEIEVPNQGKVIYKISMRSGTPFIVELFNNLPDCFLEGELKPCYLTCVIPEKNSYKFYKLTPTPTDVIAEYGRMGTGKGELFGVRTFHYPKEMFWVKYSEKIAKGYIDRTDMYIPDESEPQNNGKKKEQNSKGAVTNRISAYLFQKLKEFSKKAVRDASVNVPITKAILHESNHILQKMYKANTVDEFNKCVIEIISLLQRPVPTGDGTGVKRLLAKSSVDYARIIQRESDLIQAMEGMYYGTPIDTSTQDFAQYGIEVYEATEKQKEQVLSKLSDSLKGKVKTVYRVIPKQQQALFDAYLKEHNIKNVKQLWHGSRNQNWLSIIKNSLLLNPDAIITGKMFGNGIYFAPSSTKSWNYTSFRGTSWAGGDSDTAFMGLYAVAYGNPYDTSTWNSSTDYKFLTVNGGYDCLHAHKGSALMNDEIIFYDEAAMVLNYIVEFN